MAGVAEDHIEAIKWFRRAADKEDIDGRFLLGGFITERY